MKALVDFSLSRGHGALRCPELRGAVSRRRGLSGGFGEPSTRSALTGTARESTSLRLGRPHQLALCQLLAPQALLEAVLRESLGLVLDIFAVHKRRDPRVPHHLGRPMHPSRSPAFLPPRPGSTPSRALGASSRPKPPPDLTRRRESTPRPLPSPFTALKGRYLPPPLAFCQLKELLRTMPCLHPLHGQRTPVSPVAQGHSRVRANPSSHRHVPALQAIWRQERW